MKQRRQKLKLPAWVIAGSFLLLIVIMTLTNPLDSPFFAIVVFGLLAVLLIATGYFLTIARGREVDRRRRTRIVLVSALVLVGLMLRTSGSLDLSEAAVLLLIAFGLWFYAGRR